MHVADYMYVQKNKSGTCPMQRGAHEIRYIVFNDT